MRFDRVNLGRRGRRSGQTAVEFALVLPIALALLFGIIAASFTFYQRSSLHDGSTAGARVAAIEGQMLITPSGGQYCEFGVQSPGKPAFFIWQAVAGAAPQMAVNSNPLCAPTSNATQLTQTADPTKANIVVSVPSGSGDISAATSLTVTVSFSASGLAWPMNKLYPVTASSTVPVLNP